MLFVRNYGLPIILAVLVHALVAASLLVGWTPSAHKLQVAKPPIVNATLVTLEAKPKPKPVKAAPPKAEPPKPKPDAAPPKVAETKPPPPKPQPKPKPEPKKDAAAEKARQQKAEADKRKRRDALLASSFDEALKEESSAIDQTAEDEVARTFRQGFYELVVANWSRPPSARLGMQTELMVDLVPTGQVVGVTIVSSSGNAAFDRSAELAVRKAEKFDVPKDPVAFERCCRRVPVVFNPEDLLR